MSSLESGKGGDVVQHSKATYKAVETSPGEWKMGAMPVDPTQGFKAKEIQLLSFQRPHMRAFHFAWSSFFVRAPRPRPETRARPFRPPRADGLRVLVRLRAAHGARASGPEHPRVRRLHDEHLLLSLIHI